MYVLWGCNLCLNPPWTQIVKKVLRGRCSRQFLRVPIAETPRFGVHFSVFQCLPATLRFSASKHISCLFKIWFPAVMIVITLIFGFEK